MDASGTDHQTERFGFTVFLSACVHAMVILGVGFTYLDELTSAPTMEITLAQYRSEVAPEQADFLAQENQTGSGTLQEVAAPSTPFTSEFNTDVIQEVSPVRQAMAARRNTADTNIDVLTTLQSERALELNPEEESTEAEIPEGDDVTQGRAEPGDRQLAGSIGPAAGSLRQEAAEIHDLFCVHPEKPRCPLPGQLAQAH